MKRILFIGIILMTNLLVFSQTSADYERTVPKISEQLRHDEDAFDFFQSLVIFDLSESRQKADSLCFDHYLWRFNWGNPMCRFMVFDSIMQAVHQCSEKLITDYSECPVKNEWYARTEIVKLLQQETHSSLQDIVERFFQQTSSRLSWFCATESIMEYDTTMYIGMGVIDMWFHIDGWEGWEEPVDFVERFKKVKTKLLQDPQTWKDFNKFLRASRATRHRDPVESRAILYQYYRQLQDSRLNVFFDFDALYEISRQYNQWRGQKNKQAELTRAQTMRTNRDWYEKVVSNYKYYKHNDTDQRKELRDSFEKYLSQ